MLKKHHKERKKDIHIVHHRTHDIGKKGFSRPNQIKQGKNSSEGGKTPRSEGSQNNEDDIPRLDPNQCQVGTDYNEVKSVEREFWNSWKVTESKMIGNGSGGIVESVISVNGRLAVFGYSDGSVAVYDLNDEDPNLIRVGNAKGSIQDLQISKDSFSSISALTSDGSLKVFDMTNGETVRSSNHLAKTQQIWGQVLEMDE